MESKQTCLHYNYTNVTTKKVDINSRLTWVALPKGEAPTAGWPIYFSFVTDAFNASDGSFDSCASPPLKFTSHLNPSFGAFSLPKDSMNGCFNGSANGHFPCYFDSIAGAVWDQRIKQYLLANGVAVILVNPWTQDQWDYPYDKHPDQWETGRDRPFLKKMLAQMTAGAFGPLDLSKVIFRGFSGGAQMVSWVIQQIAVGDITGVGMSGGIFLSGGSYNCYTSPPLSRGVCKNCSVDKEKCGRRDHPEGCSDDKHPPCCDYCCPDHYAEQYYEDTPSAWPNHPPAFLAQLSGYDFNADLCATSHYHDTMQAHGVESRIVLDSVQDSAGCFCGGSPNDTAAVGSPFLGYCANHTMSCAPHTKGFAGMVEPLVQFCVDMFSK
jgi:hypothetical protein